MVILCVYISWKQRGEAEFKVVIASSATTPPILNVSHLCIYLGLLGMRAESTLKFICPSCPSCSRDLEARAQNEFFRAFFRLPRKEKLRSVVDCSLWTPFSRCHTVGRMFTSDSYICFASREDGCCNVVLPLREVGTAPTFPRSAVCFLRQTLGSPFSDAVN